MNDPHEVPPILEPELRQALGWIQTRSGKAFDYGLCEPSSIDIFDIAHALAHQCRFGGHTAWFYSVAEHSVHVSHCVPEAYALAALLHDATEAYVVDVPRPLKDLLPEYRAIEAQVWSAIAEKFQVPVELPGVIKEADDRVLLAEKEALLTRSPRAWVHAVGVQPANVKIIGLDPRDAKELFLRRFHHLQRERTR